MVENKTTKTRQEDKLIVILGPTASGKTGRAVSLSKELNGEIISADSRQVYRRMDLGTGKDLEEYGNISYHLIDICQPGEKYNLHRYISDFNKAWADIKSRGKRIILCGGTGMYLENAISGISLPEVPENPELRKRLEPLDLNELTKILSDYKNLHNTTDIDTRKRAIRAIEIEDYYRKNPDLAELSIRKNVKPIDCVIIGVDIPRDKRRERISARLKERLNQGMVEEVKALLAEGIKAEDLIYYGLEYKFLTLYAIGKMSYEEMVCQLEIAIHQFAKRQMTWFRGMERRGFTINWIPYDLPEAEFNDRVKALLS